MNLTNFTYKIKYPCLIRRYKTDTKLNNIVYLQKFFSIKIFIR